jgi:hypothetical protein
MDLKLISGLTPDQIIAKFRIEELREIGKLELSEVAVCLRGGKHGNDRVSQAELKTLLAAFGMMWEGSTWEKQHVASKFLQYFLPVNASSHQ